MGEQTKFKATDRGAVNPGLRCAEAAPPRRVVVGALGLRVGRGGSGLSFGWKAVGVPVGGQGGRVGVVRLMALVMVLLFLFACGPDRSTCGPTKALVTRVLDGDTVEIEGGEKVRYLLIDTPELSDASCYSQEAFQKNLSLVEGRTVSLSYDPVQCRDIYGRLLAYVRVGDTEVNALLIREGYACLLFIPPAGESRYNYFKDLEQEAIQHAKGLWGVCKEAPCGH